MGVREEMQKRMDDVADKAYTAAKAEADGTTTPAKAKNFIARNVDKHVNAQNASIQNKAKNLLDKQKTSPWTWALVALAGGFVLFYAMKKRK